MNNIAGNDFQIFYSCGYDKAASYWPRTTIGFKTLLSNLQSNFFTGIIANNGLIAKSGLAKKDFIATLEQYNLKFLIDISEDVQINLSNWADELEYILTQIENSDDPGYKSYAYEYLLKSEVKQTNELPRIKEAIIHYKDFFNTNFKRSAPPIVMGIRHDHNTTIDRNVAMELGNIDNVKIGTNLVLNDLYLKPIRDNVQFLNTSCKSDNDNNNFFLAPWVYFKYPSMLTAQINTAIENARNCSKFKALQWHMPYREKKRAVLSLFRSSSTNPNENSETTHIKELEGRIKDLNRTLRGL